MSTLKRVLSPMMVWGLGVGYVISGNYFGWNLGLAQGGTLGLGIATLLAIVLYLSFTLSYTELACAIPRAGGAFDFAARSLGTNGAYIAGMAQNIEFIFAPPAIAAGLASYLHIFFPEFSVVTFGIAAYILFTLINIYGIQAAASFELVVTVVAVAGLVMFGAAMMPHAVPSRLLNNAWPHGWEGVAASTPFAIWFFLGIEGIANLAEETTNPDRSISRGFFAALATLIAVCMVTFYCSVGVAGWEAVVFNADGSTSDAPLPMAMRYVEGSWVNAVVIAGLFGLVASMNGLMLAGGRSLFEFGRMVFGNVHVGRIHPRFQTPANALIVNLVIGVVALLTGKTGELITLSVFGALTLYIVSMIAMVRLRVREPELLRPFKCPAFPLLPVIALILATCAWLAMAWYNPFLCLHFLALMCAGYGIFRLYNSWHR